MVGEHFATKYYANHLRRLKRVENHSPCFLKPPKTEKSPWQPFLASSRNAQRPQRKKRYFGEERCVTVLKTAAKESTNWMAPTIWFSKRNFRFFHVNGKCKSYTNRSSVYTKSVWVPNRVLQSRNRDAKFREIPLTRGLYLASHLPSILSIPKLVPILHSNPESRASNKGNPGSRKTY